MAVVGVLRLSQVLRRKILNLSCNTAFISTTKKNKETLIIPEEVFPKKPPKGPTTAEEFADVKSQKNWISYGYSTESYEEDRDTHKLVQFLSITVIICGSTFIYMYMPDFHNRDWTVREAYLELHRRETLGLPLIDKNFIDPAKIELPSDEELGDTEIII